MVMKSKASFGTLHLWGRHVVRFYRESKGIITQALHPCG